MTIEVSDDAKAVSFVIATGFAAVGGIAASLFGTGHGETGWVLLPYIGMVAFLLLEIVSPLWSDGETADREAVTDGGLEDRVEIAGGDRNRQQTPTKHN